MHIVNIWVLLSQKSAKDFTAVHIIKTKQEKPKEPSWQMSQSMAHSPTSMRYIEKFLFNTHHQ